MANTLNESTLQVSVFPLKAQEGQTRWSKLSASSPQSSPFASLAYAEAIVSHFGLRCEIWLVSDDKSDEAGALVFYKKQGPFKRVVVPAFTQYSSLILAQETHASAPVILLLKSLAISFDDLRFHCHPAIADTGYFEQAKWQKKAYNTYQIDLLTYDSALAGWSKSARRNYNKHQQNYSFTENAQAINQCITLCAEGYGRNNRTFPADAQALLDIASDLEIHQMVRCFTVSLQDSEKPEAGIVILHDAHTAYYWIAGSKPGPAMTVLIGKVLKELKHAEFETFDFVGANTPSIAEFKRRFGPTLRPYIAGLVTPNRILNTLLRTKRLIRR
ncbi:MAG: GNAT family N-acetyltransferase [Rhodothermales bacterium]